MNRVDATHSIDLRSWVASANRAGTDFPIQNLPFGVFARHESPGSARIGIAIGDDVLDIFAAVEAGLFDEFDRAVVETLQASSLNALMALGRKASTEIRQHVSSLLAADNSHLRDNRVARVATLVSMNDIEMRLPATIGDYTDFYASAFHAFNIGSMFRPENPLLPNYKYLPVAYHGRASSVIVSGTAFRRPSGQAILKENEAPVFGPSRQLDYELEVGILVGAGGRLGQRIPIDQAESQIFGICLLNDWSARDIQRWEYQPLGPFLSKSFATTISPWVVTLDALAPFRVSALKRPEGDPEPLPYLRSALDESWGGIDLRLEVFLSSEQMRERGVEPLLLSRGNFRDMYWTMAQMLTHHSSNGCNLRAGDLLGSGTVSGPTKESRGCLLELTWRGTEPISLPTGETRRFLMDGDEVILKGYCERANAVRIGLGECRGVIEAA